MALPPGYTFAEADLGKYSLELVVLERSLVVEEIDAAVTPREPRNFGL